MAAAAQARAAPWTVPVMRSQALFSGTVVPAEALRPTIELRRDPAQPLVRQVGTPSLGRSHWESAT